MVNLTRANLEFSGEGHQEQVAAELGSICLLRGALHAHAAVEHAPPGARRHDAPARAHRRGVCEHIHSLACSCPHSPTFPPLH